MICRQHATFCPVRDPGIRFIERPRVRRPGNGFAVAGFVVSLAGLIFTLGLLSPLGLILSLIGMLKRPRRLATAGAVIGLAGTLLISGIIAACYSASQEVARHHEVRQTQHAIAQAQEEVEMFHRENGKIPEGIEGNKLVLDHQDSWEQPLRYDRYGKRYIIRSAGPDGRFETADDIASRSR